MSNKNVTLPQLQKSVSNVKNYIDYNNILTTLTSNDGCIPYRLVLTEEEIDDSYNKTITSTSISKDMFEEIYNSANCIEIWIKNNDETTNSGHDFFYETGYISGSYGTNNGLRKKIFSKKIFDPIFKASGNCCNYLKINYIFEEQEDSTITLKTEHLDSISYNIDLFPIIHFENDNNEYIAVYDLKNALYLSNINLSDTDGLILKTDIKNIDLYNIYGNNCIVSCSVENNNVSLILPDRIIKGEIKSKTSIILSNTTEILFSDDIKKYVDDSMSSLTIPTKTSELTNDSNFITSIPSEYITETTLESRVLNNLQLSQSRPEGARAWIRPTFPNYSNEFVYIDDWTHNTKFVKDNEKVAWVATANEGTSCNENKMYLANVTKLVLTNNTNTDILYTLHCLTLNGSLSYTAGTVPANGSKTIYCTTSGVYDYENGKLYVQNLINQGDLSVAALYS